MRVTVVPQRPIKGILPKNKWITEEMELDLNRNEIIRCMAYGSVFYNGIQIVNSDSLNKAEKSAYLDLKMKVDEEIKQPKLTKIIIHDVKEIPKEQTEVPKEQPVIEEVNNDIKIDYTLSETNCTKENEYIILDVQFNTSVGEIAGNMYGLFNIIGKRPSTLEVKVDSGWVKFNSNFRNFSTLKDGDKFTFRFIPRDESIIKYNVMIKDGKTILAKLMNQIDPTKL